MDGQNNGVVPPVGGEIASPNPTPVNDAAEKPTFETPNAEAAAPAPAAPAPVAPASAAPAQAAPAPNPTAQFAQSTVGSTAPQNSFATPAAQPVMTQQSVIAPAPAKKGGAGKIIAVIVIIVLLIGAGVGGFLFYRAHESNERVLADALKNVLSNGARSTAVNATVKTDEYNVELKLDQTSNTEAEASLTLDVKVSGDEIPEISGKVEAVEGKDALYVRVADYGTIANAIGELSEDEDLEYQLSAIFNSVGDSWYEIPYSTLGSDYKKSVDCAREFSKELYGGAYTDELTESFKAHPFISIDGKPTKADGYKLYKIKIDEDESEEFGKELEDGDLYSDLKKCYESASSYSTLKSNDGGVFSGLLGNGDNTVDQTITSDLGDDLDDWDDEVDDWSSNSSSNLEDVDIYLGISAWKHELKHIKINYTEDNNELNVDIDLKDAGDVQTPSNAKSLEELKTTIESSVGGSTSKMESYYEMYCTEEENYSGYASEEECKAAVDEYFGGSSDIESLINGLNI